MARTAGPSATETRVGVISTLGGIVGLAGLAIYWMSDPAALAGVLRIAPTSEDGATFAALAGTFRAVFDLFAAAVLGLLLARRAWSLLAAGNLLTLLFIPVGDAVIWWATLPDPSAADLVPHAVLALPFLVASIALSRRHRTADPAG